MTPFRLVYMTAGSRDEARRIADLLLARRLAACVNIFAGVESHYWWEGEREQADEVVLIAKTRSACLSELRAAVTQIHSYDCPCIMALAVDSDGSHPPYLDWIERETAGT